MSPQMNFQINLNKVKVLLLNLIIKFIFYILIKIFIMNKLILKEFYKINNKYYKLILSWLIRLICSTNHKDIGTSYLIFSGIIRVILPLLIWFDLIYPNFSILYNNYNLYNIIIITYILITIFFLLCQP